MKRKHLSGIARAWLVVLVVSAGAAVAGCAGAQRVPECHGPWSPINVAPEDHRHG